MKRLILPLLALPLFGAEPNLSEQLRDALYTEEVTRDPAAAAETYSRILADFDTQRPLAATALFRLAEICRNAGETNKAIAHYQRLLREFPDHETEAKLSRQHLATLGGEEPTADTSIEGEEAAELRRLRKLAKTAPDIILDPKTLDNAIDQGWPEVTSYLLKNGSDPSQVNALYHAAGAGRLDLCHLLVAHGADDKSKNEAMVNAIRKGRIAVIQFFINNGVGIETNPEFSWSLLHEAIDSGNITALELLLDRGADIDFVIDNEAVTDYSKLFGTPLHQAVIEGNFEIFKLLIERGAKPDIKAPQSLTTPLHLAVMTQGQHGTKYIEALLKAGADPNSKHQAPANARIARRPTPPGLGITKSPLWKPDEIQTSPLEIARQTNGLKAAKLLLEAGAKVEDSDIRRSVEINAIPWVELLLSHMPRFEADDPLGRKLLEIATNHGFASATPLIKHGASPSDEQIAYGFPHAPHEVLPHLNESFLLPILTKETKVHLLLDRIAGQSLVVLAEANTNQPPPSLAKALLDAKTSYTRLSDSITEYQWILWRSDETGKLESIRFDLMQENALPQLNWGDVIERRIVNVPDAYSTQEADHLPAPLIWSLVRRISFPITVSLGEDTRKFNVRGDRISYDPTVSELPYLDANKIVNLLYPELNLSRTQVSVTVRRKDWQDTTMKMGSKALTRFMLRRDDQLILSPSATSNTEISEQKALLATLRISGTSYSSFWGVQSGASLMEILSSAYSSELFLWSRDRLSRYSKDTPTRLGELVQSISNRKISTPVILPHPDFSNIRIHRIDESGVASLIEVDLAGPISSSSDATTPRQAKDSDVAIQKGDVIEISLKESNGDWTGLSPQQALFFKRALSGACQITSADGEVTRHFINWQPTQWLETPAGRLPHPPKDGISCTRIMDLGVDTGNTREILRDGKSTGTISSNSFIRNGDQLNITASQIRRVRRAPTPPSP